MIGKGEADTSLKALLNFVRPLTSEINACGPGAGSDWGAPPGDFASIHGMAMRLRIT